ERLQLVPLMRCKQPETLLKEVSPFICPHQGPPLARPLPPPDPNRRSDAVVKHSQDTGREPPRRIAYDASPSSIKSVTRLQKRYLVNLILIRAKVVPQPILNSRYVRLSSCQSGGANPRPRHIRSQFLVNRLDEPHRNSVPGRIVHPLRPWQVLQFFAESPP